MLKVRLQGTKKDIRWYLKGLNRDSRYIVDSVSDFRQCKKSEKYHMLYVNIFRKDAKEKGG